MRRLLNSLRVAQPLPAAVANPIDRWIAASFMTERREPGYLRVVGNLLEQGIDPQMAVELQADLLRTAHRGPRAALVGV